MLAVKPHGNGRPGSPQGAGCDEFLLQITAFGKVV